MSNNELVVTLKPGGSATEWLVIHADDPNTLRSYLREVDNGLAAEVAAVAARYRQATSAGGAGPQPVQAWPTQAELAQPPAPAWGAPAQAAPIAAAPVAQATPVAAAPPAQAQPVQQAAPAAQQWSASPQPQAAPQWNPQPPNPLQPGPNLKEWVTGTVGPNGRPMGTDGYETNWKVVQPTAVKGGWAAFMSGAPKDYPAQGGPTGPKQEPIWVDRVKKLG